MTRTKSSFAARSNNEGSPICCIFDQAAHYRAPIYKLMDEEIFCDFYISKWNIDPFKQMNYNELSGLIKISKNISLVGKWYWQSNTFKLAFRNYNKYIMIGNLYSLSTWFLLVILRIMGKKAYLWSHGWYGREGKIKTILKKIFFLLPYKTFLYGNYAKDLMIKEGIPREKLVTIYNSLDYRRQIEIRANLNDSDIYKKRFNNSDPVMIYIGRIQKIKKLDLLIEAFFNLRVEDIKCNLVIIGKEVENIGLDVIIKDYKLEEYVWLYGECYEEEKIAELIYNADLCVSPGNVGLTAIHNLTYGTPVITHNNFTNQMPEFEAIQDGKTGLFFKENSADDLKFKIYQWLSFADSKRDLIRSACYKVIDQYYNPFNQIKILKQELK